MHLTATLLNYYFVCWRKAWLHANGITMEHTSDLVYEGKHIHETSYPQRASKYKETEIKHDITIVGDGGGHQTITLSGKIDNYDLRTHTIHETKKSNKVEDAHEWQIKFYLYILHLMGNHQARGLLEYPKLRTTTEVVLSPEDIQYLNSTIPKLASLLEQEQCPPRVKTKLCKSCSYFDLCFSGESPNTED